MSASGQREDLAAAERLSEREEILEAFIDSESERLARACHENW